MSQIIVPYRRAAFKSGGGSGGSAVLWASWAEDSELTLALDQNLDLTEDTNVCFMENTTAGGNETSRGVLAGADRVFTDASGNTAGASGTPPRRVFDGADDGMISTVNWPPGLFLESSGWMVLLKVNYAGGGAVGDRFFDIIAGTDNIQIELRAGNAIRFYVRKDGGNLLFADTANALTSGAVRYLMVAGTATTCYGGFTATRPTKWSDFAAGDRVSQVNDARFAAGDLAGAAHLMYDGGAGTVPGTLYYAIATKAPGSFINFAA
jgi:hypothetical protein